MLVYGFIKKRESEERTIRNVNVCVCVCVCVFVNESLEIEN